MRLLTVSCGGLDKAAITAVRYLSWDDFATALTKEPPELSDKAARGWYIPATFTASHRHGGNFVSRDAITFDFDHVTLDSWGNVQNAFHDIAFAMYTTYSHTYDKPRFRVVIPLSRSVDEKVYQAVARKVATRVGIELVARESFVPAQMMYLPARRLGGEFEGFVGESEKFLMVDEVLGEYEDWADRNSWPHRADGDDIHAVPDGITPPDEKPGIVGDFCRRFRVAEAILRFDLPYKPSATPGRWTYLNGSVPGGCIEYDEGLKFHSHHDTDPCRGQHNCFDLVRITRFGHLDAGRPEGAGPSDWPSYRAMVDFVLSLPEFKRQAADEFTDLSGGAGDGLGEAGAEPRGSSAGEKDAVNEPRAPERFVVQSAADFSSGPPLDWIVRSVLPRAELAVVYGESGSGKSFLAIDLCAAITRGVEWRGRRVARGSGVYICAEGAGGFKARLRAYARGHGVEIHQLPAVVADAPNLLEAKDAGMLTAAIAKWGKPDVVVIDTLSATTPGGNENSGEDMGRVLSHCKLLHRHTGALVVLIHHSGKDATKGARGWSGLRAAADAEIEITRNGDFRTASITKMKDGSDGEQFTFKLKVVELDSLNDEPQSSCIIEHVESAPARTKSKKRPSGNPLLVLEVLEKMAPVGSCHVEDLIEGVKPLLPRGKTDKRRSVIDTAMTSLVTNGHAFMHGEDRIGLTTLQTGDWLDQ